jgi:DnaJ-class molecular chaperone
MKRVVEHRKLFGITKDANLAELKVIYRNLMKEWHPDKYEGNEAAKLEAEAKSKGIIEAYHFLVSLAPETHLQNKAEYTNTITNSGIENFNYKGQTLEVMFNDGSVYEYFSVPKATYNKLVNSATQLRFARRHIFENFIYRRATKVAERV